MKKKYKIIAIAQIYNELEKGHLERFLKYIKPIADALVVYDDGSTEGSYEFLSQYTPYVIRGGKNDFSDEMYHKKLLVEKAKELGADFIFYLDADEVFTKNAKDRFQELAQMCIDKKIDGLQFHKINIWRSATWQRTDSLYDIGWFTHFWRVTPDMQYTNLKKGLHQVPYPATIKKIEKIHDISVLHYGFSNEKNLAYKYLVYKSHGLRGYDMLDRLINEDTLELRKISQKLFPDGLYVDNEPKPKKIPLSDALSYVEKYKEQVWRPKYSIVCLIYKSVEWLQFVHEQVLKYTDMKDVEFYFVANDATPEVLDYLKNNYIPHYVWNNTEDHKKEWYINNVYRAWNFGAKQAKGDFIIFINSDMSFSQNWLENLIKSYNGKNCVTSRLVESGKMESGQYGIEKNFGRAINTYKEEKFQKYALEISKSETKDSGLYMPLFIRKEHFLSVDGYPEGNPVPGNDIFNPKLAKLGEPCIPGDTVFMAKLKSKGIIHQTAFNSIVYHFQEGEMDSKKTKRNSNRKTIAICNDLVTGAMGEKVLWDFLLQSLPSSYCIDTRIVGKEKFEENAKLYIEKKYPETQIIIQNASFMDTIDRSRYTIGFLQDNLRLMGKNSNLQEKNLKHANKLVTNSLQTAMSYPEYDFNIIPIGVNEALFKPLDKKKLRKKYSLGVGKVGIFVGSFSEVKGWSQIKECINTFPKITWILVSKYKEDFIADNVIVYNQITQEDLAELYNCADFFIIGSAVETQCLAAIEAGLCNIPLVMNSVGIFKDFTKNEHDSLGIFDEDFISAVNKIGKKKYSPRKIILEKNLTVKHTTDLWKTLLEKVSQEITLQKIVKLKEKNIPKKERMKKKILQTQEKVSNSLQKISDRSIYLLRRMKHKIVVEKMR